MANERLTSITSHWEITRFKLVGVHHPCLLQSFSLAAAWSWGRRQFLQSAQEATLIAAKSDRERVFVRRTWFKKTAHQHRHNLIQQTSSESIKEENQQQKLRQCKRYHTDTLQRTRALQKHFWRWLSVSQRRTSNFLEWVLHSCLYIVMVWIEGAHIIVHRPMVLASAHMDPWIKKQQLTRWPWWWVGNVEAGAYQGNLSICLEYPWIIAWGGIWSRIEILTDTSLHPKWPMNLMTHYPPGTSPRSLAFIKGFHPKCQSLDTWWFSEVNGHQLRYRY